MDAVDRDLLNMVQREFPLERHPYRAIAGKLGITEKECIDRLTALNSEGVLREIRPVVNWTKAGFTGVLIGIEVAPDRIDAVAAALSSIPGVTHNYQRDGRLNLWCTLTCDGGEEQNRCLAFMREQPGVKDLKLFASEKTYKIGLLLNV